MATDIFFTEIPLVGKREGDATDAWLPAFVWREWWFLVTGVVLL